VAKGDGAGGHNIDRALHQPEKQKHVIDKLGTMVGNAIAWDGCVPDTTPCGCCASCRRRACVRVVAEALGTPEDAAHGPWTLEETGQVLMALGLKLSPREAA
jgi:hypothetical protein